MNGMTGEYNPHEAIQFIWDWSPKLAAAKGELAQLEAFKSSLKAILMTQSQSTTIAGKEMEALASSEYQTHCDAIGRATADVEKLRWQLEAAKMRFEAWRPEPATKRQLDRMI